MSHAAKLLPIVLLGGLLASGAEAREWVVRADGTPSLTTTLERAGDGDTVRVVGGVHPGALTVTRSITLVGEGWPVLDGGGRGTVLAVRAPGVTVEGFVVRASGSSLDQENSGLALEAPGGVIRGNRLEDVLFGIYLRKAPGSRIVANRITAKELPLPRRGDAIRVWYSDGVTLEGNRVTGSRDVVLWYSSELTVRGNRVSDGRYGLHFMYCDDALITGNLLLDNSVGAFLMYSRRLRFRANTVAGNHGPSGYGIGLKDMDDAEIEGNRLLGNRVGLFLDNSPREIGSRSRIAANRIAANDAGVVLLPNVRRSTFTGNGFVDNREQVRVAGSGADPEGNSWHRNHWSDYAGYDADGDGVGEIPYRADRLFENLADRHEALRLFAGSPATRALDFAARAFPLVAPRPKLVDPYPLMRPPRISGTPELPRPGRGGFLPTASGMVALALLILALPRAAAQLPLATGGSTRAAEGAETSLVEVEGLTKRYGSTRALDGVSFSIRRGEAVALWGANGAGKTTALRALLGVLPCTGRLAVAGLDPRRQGKAVRRQIGFVPQEIAHPAGLSVEETLRFFARLRGVGRGRLEQLTAELELDAYRQHPVETLSGGWKQRLALAVALLGDPALLFLDEPTANLDARARRELLELLVALQEQGKTLLFTSHRAEEVALVADRVLHLDAGRLIHEATPEELFGAEADRVRLSLSVAPERVPEARRHLARAGFLVNGGEGRLIVELAASRKVEPIALLLEAGLDVEDFEVTASDRAREEA